MWIKSSSFKIEINDAYMQAFVDACERNHVEPSCVINDLFEDYVRRCDNYDKTNRLPKELDLAEKARKK